MALAGIAAKGLTSPPTRWKEIGVACPVSISPSAKEVLTPQGASQVNCPVVTSIGWNTSTHRPTISKAA